MRDCDVRQQLDRRLRDIHAQEPSSRLLPEMVLGRGVSRIDFAVVNGKLHGYEIKSDADTLDRLATQAEAYNSVFDEITIVVGSRHLSRADKAIARWWGIIKAEVHEGTVFLTDLRRPKQNPQQSARALADLLWKEEAMDLLRRYSDVKSINRKNRDTLSFEIWARLDLVTVANFTRETLKARVRWRVDERRT